MTIAAMKQALEALTPFSKGNWTIELALNAQIAITALRTAIQQAESEPVGEPRARVELMKTGGNVGLSTRIIELDIATRERLRPGDLLYTHPAPGVPEFSRIAKRKLDELQEQGFAITGYAIQRGTERGFITDGGFVGWWRSDEAQGAQGAPDDAIDSAIYSQCPDFDDWHEGPSIDDIRAIVRAAIQQAEAKTDEPVAWRYQPDDGLKFPGFTQYEAVAVSRGKPGTVLPLFTHPAPGVPDEVVRDAERYRWLRDPKNHAQIGIGQWTDDGFGWRYGAEADEIIDASMLTAAQAQKGGE